MKRSLFVKSLALLLAALSIAAVPSASTEVDVSKVFGCIRVVDGCADSCGQWEFVTFAEDFTVQFVDFGEDFTVEFVDFAEGLP